MERHGSHGAAEGFPNWDDAGPSHTYEFLWQTASMKSMRLSLQPLASCRHYPSLGRIASSARGTAYAALLLRSCQRVVSAANKKPTMPGALFITTKPFTTSNIMPSRYAAVHKTPGGPGDARPTALDVVKDEELEGKLSDKVVLITGCSSGIGMHHWISWSPWFLLHSI